MLKDHVVGKEKNHKFTEGSFQVEYKMPKTWKEGYKNMNPKSTWDNTFEFGN